MDLDRLIERAMKNPETRVRVYLAFNIGLILVNISIILGLALFFLSLTGHLR